MGPLRVLFFGSDAFSVTCCERLLRNVRSDGGSIVSDLQIVTPPDNPRTKRPEVPLKTFARSMLIRNHVAPARTLKNWEVFLAHVRDELNKTPQRPRDPFHIAVVVSFGYFLPSALIRSFPLGAINVHPSLLPRYRGAAPIQHTILNGDRHTGVSIIELDENEFDAGRILRQTEIEVPDGAHYRQLHDQLASLGAEELMLTLTSIEDHKERAKVQSNQLASRAPKIAKEMAHVRWSDINARDVFRLHRAIGEKIPLFCSLYNGRRVQLCSMLDPEKNPYHGGNAGTPGDSVYDRTLPALFVRCRDAWLPVTSLKVEGKRVLVAADFVNGYQTAVPLFARDSVKNVAHL